MTLTELAPHWVAEYHAPADAKQGIGFLCPHCQVTRLAVFFDVPIGGHLAAAIVTPGDTLQAHIDQAEQGHLMDYHIGRILWHREGVTFETLSLTPSVDASHFGHWHGFITNGEIR
jgi:Family of unknown function (DUF6527)